MFKLTRDGDGYGDGDGDGEACVLCVVGAGMQLVRVSQTCDV